MADARVFSAAAVQYRQARPGYPPALFDWLAALAPARNLAWDVGCGSGQATAELSRCFARVIANDPSAEQIAQAPALGNVDWRVAGGEDVVLDAGSVDLVLAASSLHWMDLDRFYPRAQHALKPGGVMAAIGYATTVLPAHIRPAIKTVFAPIGRYWSDAHRRAWAGYDRMPFPFTPVSLKDNPPPVVSVDLAWTLDQYLAYASTWSAMLEHRQATGLDLTPIAREALAPLWGEGTQPVSMPLVLKLGRRL